MPFKSIDDIENEKKEQEREKLKENISEDINDVVNRVIKKRKDSKPPKKSSPWKKFLGFLLGVVLFLILINLFLGNIWLLRFFIKSLFGLG